MDNSTESQDQCKMMTGVFLHLAKAFDTINHDILLNNYMPMESEQNDWLVKCYLENSLLYTQIQNSEYSNKNIANGVPKGSILGHLLLILYVNNFYTF